jgi:hypothetical protein
MNHLIDSFKIIVEGSQTLTSWSLMIIAGSIAVIVGTSYLRPQKVAWRLPFLLFILGWVFLSLSIYNGDKISRSYMAAVLINNEKKLMEIGQAINTYYDAQLSNFARGLIGFAIWLVIFLLWWIFDKAPQNSKKHN